MRRILLLGLSIAACADVVHSRDAGEHGAGAGLAAQNAALNENTDGKGFGPQAPRDLSMRKGTNQRLFAAAPAYKKMNLCNIHFHKNAEHRWGEFKAPANESGGHAAYSGHRYSGKLSTREAEPLAAAVCEGEHGGLQAGDTIEVHYVHSTAQVAPGPTLKACFSESLSNPQLRVEAQVFVLVNDLKAKSFVELTRIGSVKGYHQALNIPNYTGKPIQYPGSTTGPAYNEKGSPFQVTWSVRPKVMKVGAESVGTWCKENPFKENHAHGVRNLVVNEALLSAIR